MDQNAAVPTPPSSPLGPEPAGAPPHPLAAWPPPGLERLRGDLWVASSRLDIGGAILVLPLLAALSLPQDPWRPSLFGDAWWILLVTSVVGGVVLLDGFVRLVRLLARWRAAVGRGYRGRTVAMVLADRGGDTGHLVQGARAYSLIPASVRRLLVTGRMIQVAVAVGAAMWLSAGFMLSVLGAARGILTEVGLALWTLGPWLAGGALIGVLRAAESTFVIRARKAWHAKPWSEDLAREEIQRWHEALARREEALPVPVGTVGARGVPQRVGIAAAVAAGLFVVVFAVPLVSVSGIGPVLTAIALPRFSATAEKAGRAEALQALRPSVDPSLSVQQAGEALLSLVVVSESSDISLRRRVEWPRVIPDEEWRDNPTGLRPEFWARDLVPRLAEGLDPAVVAYLQGLGDHPAFASLSVLARAPALDEVGALYVLPLPPSLGIWDLPIPKYSGTREVAYAQVGVAVAEAAGGRVDDAERRLQELIGAGTLLAREGTTLIANLIGVVIAGIGGDALLNLYEATGQTRKAAELHERLRATEAAMKWVGWYGGGVDLEGMQKVVTDTSALRGLRWEFFSSLSGIGPCLNLQRAVFGPPADHGAWVDQVRASLVRYEGEEEILEVMQRGFSMGDRESGLLSVARLYAQVLGGGVGSCAELLAAVAMW